MFVFPLTLPHKRSIKLVNKVIEVATNKSTFSETSQVDDEKQKERLPKCQFPGRAGAGT